MSSIIRRKLLLIFLLVLALSLLTYLAVNHTLNSPVQTLEFPEPLRLDLRVAVVSGDRVFVEGLARAMEARELRVLPPEKAEDAVGYDLVVLGWDALARVSSNRELTLKLLRSKMLVAAARPGGDAVGTLLSSIVKPAKLGLKEGVEEPPIAFFPVYEHEGYLHPGAPGVNLVLMETWELKDGRLGAGYTALGFSREEEAGRAIAGLLRYKLERSTEQHVLNFQAGGRAKLLFAEYPYTQYTHIGGWRSVSYPIVQGSGGQVGETYVDIKVAYCTNCQNAQYPYIKTWLVFLQGHYAKTWSGFSLPVRALGNWVIEPSTALVNSLTGVYPDQRIGSFVPAGAGTDGEISVTISYPPGITYTSTMLPEVTWDGDATSTYSIYYGGYVLSDVIWRWGLTSYDGSGTRWYYMSGYAELDSLEPLYFTVRMKANAYMVTRGIAATATSGRFNFDFTAYADHLEYQGGYKS